MALVKREIPAFMGKEIKVMAFQGGGADRKSERIRGAQNVTTTEERPETRILEMGSDASSVIYGPANYSASVTLMGRDLYMLGKMAGIDVDNVNGMVLTDFQSINLVEHFEKPDTEDVVFSKLILGWQSRTSSTPTVADGTATITLEGGADLVAETEGKNEVEEFKGEDLITEGNNSIIIVGGTPVCFTLVETPAGQVYAMGSKLGDDTTTSVDVDGGSITLLGYIPSDKDIVRVAYQV